MKSFTKKSLSILALSLTGAVACGSFVGCGGDDDDTTPPGTDAGATRRQSTTDSGGGTTDGGSTDAGTTDSGHRRRGRRQHRPGRRRVRSTIRHGHRLPHADADLGVATYSDARASPPSPTGLASATTSAERHHHATVQRRPALCSSARLPSTRVDAGADAGVTRGIGTTERPAAAHHHAHRRHHALPGSAVALTPDATTGRIRGRVSSSRARSSTSPAADAIRFAAAGGSASVGAFTTTVAAPADLTAATPASRGARVRVPRHPARRGPLRRHLDGSGTRKARTVTVTLTAVLAEARRPARRRRSPASSPAVATRARRPSRPRGLAHLDHVRTATGTSRARLTIHPDQPPPPRWGAGRRRRRRRDHGLRRNQDCLVTTTVSGTAAAGSVHQQQLS